MNIYGIDYDFIELLEMKILQGRSFSRSMADTGSYIINETAAHSLNRENPIGTKLALWGKEGPIVGVVKDFHFKSLNSKISPTVLYLRPTYLNTLLIKLTDAPIFRGLNFIENRLRIFAKEVPLKYSTINERLSDRLLDIRKWATLAGCIGAGACCSHVLVCWVWPRMSQSEKQKKLASEKPMEQPYGISSALFWAIFSG